MFFNGIEETLLYLRYNKIQHYLLYKVNCIMNLPKNFKYA